MVTISCGELNLEDIDLVCFDKDGTLLTLDMYKPVMEKRTQLLLEKYALDKSCYNDLLSLMGLDPETKEIIHGGPIHIERVKIIKMTREYLRKLSINSSVEDIAELFDEADHFVDFTQYVESFDGVQQLLKEIRDSGTKLLLVTHDSTEPASKQLASAGLLDFFDLVLGLDIDSPYLGKPAPDMLQYGCKKLKVDITRSIVVGDDNRDMLMGKNAGAGCCVGVLSGMSKENELTHADVIISTVATLKIV